MANATLIFSNGTQLQLPSETGGDIASKFAAYTKAPTSAGRVISVRYSADGGTNNRSVTVDLQALTCVLHT